MLPRNSDVPKLLSDAHQDAVLRVAPQGVAFEEAGCKEIAAE